MPQAEIPNFATLADFYQTLGIPLGPVTDFTIHRIEDLHKQPRTSQLFRAQYFSFFFVRSGQGSYTIDGVTYPVGAGTVYFTNPGHLKAFATRVPYTGWVVTFTEAWIKQNVSAHIFRDYAYLVAEKVPDKTIALDLLDQWDNLLQLVHTEFNREKPDHKILGSLWAAILGHLKREFWSDFEPNHEAQLQGSISDRFRHQLEDAFRNLSGRAHLPNVQDMAAAQNLNSNYFQTVIKAQTGRTPLSWINEKTMAEAKARLAMSQLSVKAIAEELRFPDQAHFARFFKKHAGVSPAGWRIQPN